MNKSILYSALVLVGLVNSRISNGFCPNVELQANFDAAKYVGTWFNGAKDVDSPFENGYCEQQRIGINTDGTLGVYNSQFDNET